MRINGWCQCTSSAVFSFVLNFSVQAADWMPVIQVGSNVREIDTSSIVGTQSIFAYTTRHVFGGLNEYSIAKRGIKYLVISSQADCLRQTTLRLAVDAYDENMLLVSKQALQHPEETIVSPDSIEQSVLKYVCQAK